MPSGAGGGGAGGGAGGGGGGGGKVPLSAQEVNEISAQILRAELMGDDVSNLMAQKQCFFFLFVFFFPLLLSRSSDSFPSSLFP